ncbi:MAG: aminotransferase class I/II-fold pyridoxal phosphate-dependent enzyme [Acetatifactor sp.]
MQHLFEKLNLYSSSDIYPYHMPGHKRNSCNRLPGELYRNDVTEIDGFDDLHQPEGILRDLQKSAAELYGADESFYLVNGSSCGILSSISAVLPTGGHLLMARNCHKSVYHAVYLRKLRVTYLWPQVMSDYDIFDVITPEQVEEALEKEPDIGAVLVVSPTYEGRISDIKSIAEAVHRRGIPLIVDEAHGAHLGLAPKVHENSCRLGADIVIHSVHKTLPALTQSALLHVNGGLVKRNRLKRFLHIYQSSSPSYLLMASIDNALEYVKRDGDEAFAEFEKRYLEMLSELKQCKKLCFLPYLRENQDLGKLVICVKNADITGKELYDILLNEYHLQLEMAVHSYALAMFTVNDTAEAYGRMSSALLRIDQALTNEDSGRHRPAEGVGIKLLPQMMYGKNSVIPLAEAWDQETEEVLLTAAAGRKAGEFVNLYPPGVPYLVPGEEITKDSIDWICEWMRQGLKVQGIIGKEEGTFIRVLRTKDGKIDW